MGVFISTIKSADEADLRMLYNNEGVAFEGVDLSSLENEEAEEFFIKKLVSNGLSLKNDTTVYIAKGSVINKLYDLAGDNAYGDDFVISIIPYDDCIFEYPDNTEFMKELKINLNIRYWEDIVDNNEYREYKAGRHPHSKQIEWLVDYFNKQEETK